MIRKRINCNRVPYLVDFYKYEECSEHISKQFVILRNFDIVNDNIEDKDLFFIDKNSLNDIISNDREYQSLINGYTKKIVFPVPTDDSLTFSANYKDYIGNQFSFSFKTNTYELYDNRYNDPIDIPCDVIKVYHPHVVKNFNGIIYLDCYINNIHIHLFCKRYDLEKTYSKEEIRVDSNIYSEYIKVCIPNIEYLLSGKVYFKEDLYKTNFAESDSANGNYIQFSCFTLPYKISQDGNVVKKIYITTSDIERKRRTISYPINITLYPSTTTDINNNKYILGDNRFPSTNTFLCTDYKIKLASHLSFNNGKISLVSKFQYPMSIDIEEHIKEYINKVSQAAPELANNKINIIYKYLNSLSIDQCKEYSDFELDEEDLEAMSDNLDGHYIGEPVRCLGYIIDIATDSDFKNIIYSNTTQLNPTYYDSEYNIIDDTSQKGRSSQEIVDCELIDDFAQELNNIFESWDQHPDILTIRATFMDNYLGNIIYSNYVVITKEYFKYLINNTDVDNKVYRVMITNKDIEKRPVFIDNFKCIINKTVSNDTISGTTINNTPKIMYKPVFYRVGSLQNLSIRQNVTQNIGINLVDFMTKVETFKLCIDGNQYIEYARNDIFVIFNINAQQLSNDSGTYDITNQDDEYISSGNWSVV